jgi:hypothetical protein
VFLNRIGNRDIGIADKDQPIGTDKASEQCQNLAKTRLCQQSLARSQSLSAAGGIAAAVQRSCVILKAELLSEASIRTTFRNFQMYPVLTRKPFLVQERVSLFFPGAVMGIDTVLKEH